ncbi:MAG: hypothetical protein ACI9ZT_001778 [Gammaproteobacteria bacterium]|jgi:hypothetical protein
MKDSLTGACACRAIQYECTSEPVFSWKCHCRDCQRASGSMLCPVMYVPKTALKITGQAKFYEVKAESGNAVRRGFCADCGCPVFIDAELVPDLMGLWAASLDDPNRFSPQVEVWTGSAQSWTSLHPGLDKCDQAPSAEQMEKILAL